MEHRLGPVGTPQRPPGSAGCGSGTGRASSFHPRGIRSRYPGLTPSRPRLVSAAVGVSFAGCARPPTPFPGPDPRRPPATALSRFGGSAPPVQAILPTVRSLKLCLLPVLSSLLLCVAYFPYRVFYRVFYCVPGRLLRQYLSLDLSVRKRRKSLGQSRVKKTNL